MPIVAIKPDLDKIKLPELVDVRDFSQCTEEFFLALIHLAYTYHLTPSITPDDVFYGTILPYFADHVNDHESHYRPYLADKENPDGKTKIEVYVDQSFDIHSQSDLLKVFEGFTSKMNKKTLSNDLLAKISSDFTTTTSITRLLGQVGMSKMMDRFFALKVIALW